MTALLAKHIQATYRMPVYGWCAHPKLPIYNFVISVNTDVFFGRNVPRIGLCEMRFTGTVEEAKEAARTLRELELIKEGVQDGNE